MVMAAMNSIGLKILLAILFLIAVVFYDITMPIVNEIIKLKVSFFGFFLEPILQAVFNVSLRQAQVISAWIYLSIAILIFWYFLLKAFFAVRVVFRSACAAWLRFGIWYKIGLLLLALLLIVVVGKSVLIFL